MKNKPSFKQILKTFLKWFFIELPLEISAFLVVPIALLFCNEKSENLPKIFKWYDDFNYGINGDDGWKTEHFPNGTNRTYYARLRFLLRNRISYFTTKYMGVEVKNIKDFNAIGDFKATCTDKVKSTKCYVEANLKNGKKIYGYYRSIHYLKYFYIRIYLGYKLMDLIPYLDKGGINAYLENKNTKKILQSVFAINPFKIKKA